MRPAPRLFFPLFFIPVLRHPLTLLRGRRRFSGRAPAVSRIPRQRRCLCDILHLRPQMDVLAIRRSMGWKNGVLQWWGRGTWSMCQSGWHLESPLQNGFSLASASGAHRSDENKKRKGVTGLPFAASSTVSRWV